MRSLTDDRSRCPYRGAGFALTTAWALIVLCVMPLTVRADGERADRARDVQHTGTMMQVGEELEYRVTYSFFHIGTIRFRVTDRGERDGRTVYHTETIIDSNPALSWLTDVHIRFYGETDEDVYSYWWIGDDSSSKGVDYREIRFDYPNHRMFYDWGKKLPGGQRRQEGVDTVAVSGRGQDGLSLFFYAREHARDKKTEIVPTFIENKEAKTTINFLSDRQDVEIDSVDYPVDAVYLNGRADFVGVFGLTGGFEGWFSNDDARIPIIARLKVILGSIKVELIRWKRGTWMPPRVEKAP